MNFEFEKIEIDRSQIEIEAAVNLFRENGSFVGERFQSEVAGQ